MRFRAIYTAALVCLGAALGCLNVDTQGVVTKCFVRATNANWNPAGLDVDVSTPDRCPFPIPSGLFAAQDYLGIVIGDPQYVGSNGYVPFNENSTLFVRVFNSDNPPQLANKLGVVPVNIFSGSPPRSEARVSYTAGTGFTNLFDTKGHDYGYIDVKLRNQSSAQGRADLSFTYTVSAVVVGPSSVAGGATLNISTKASNFRAPLTYKWWKNGSLMSGVTWPGFSTSGPTAGATVTYKVEMTDADGDKGAGSLEVRGTSPPPPGGGGGGCQSPKPNGAGPAGVPTMGNAPSTSAYPCP